MPIDLSSVNANFLVVLPELVLLAFTLVVLVWDLYAREKQGLGWVSLLGVALAMATLWFTSRPGVVEPGDYFGRMVAADAFTYFMKAVFLLVAGMIILLSMDWVAARMPKVQVEFYELVLFATLGMVFMAGSRDVVLIYLGLELASQSSYILAGLLRRDTRSHEAALKYFLNGALASAVLLYGISLLYGLTGTTYLPDMAAVLGSASRGLGIAALVFVVAGFGFKVAAAPFHLWAPDAYEGAPTPVTGFFSIGPKAAAFAAILRVFLVGLGDRALTQEWSMLWAILAAASMFIGNLTALWQTNFKRMMAYSSISHAGYILTGVVAAAHVPEAGTGAVLFYVLGYALTNLGVWAVMVAMENAGTGTDLEDFKGLGQRAPIYAWSMVFLLVSLIGVPPTVGFFGKFFLFTAAVDAGYLWLAVIMAVNSAVSIGYYYGVVRNMFLSPTEKPALHAGAGPAAVIALSVFGVLLVGLSSAPFIDYARSTVALFFP